MWKKVRNKEKLYLKIIDTSDENIKYHAMKNIIYRRKIMKMYYCYAGNKKAVITSLLFCTKNGVKNIFKKLEKSIDTC